MTIASRLLGLLIASAMATANCVFAQEYPAKSIRLIVGNTAGTTSDLVARAVAGGMSKVLGQAVIVEPKPGADQVIALEYVAKQPIADGYTAAIVTVSNLALVPMLAKDARFDPIKDLPPVLTIAAGPFYIGTSAKAPWKNLNELIAYAKANPGKLNYGSLTFSNRIRIEAILAAYGIRIVHVPYATGAAMEQALFAGDIHLINMNVSLVAQKARVRGLAISGKRRNEAFPEIPTYAELGLPLISGFEYSLNVPGGLRKDIFDKLFNIASRALRDPVVGEQLQRLGMDVVNDTPEAAMRSLVNEMRLLEDIAQRSGMHP